jgi:hypothetical protein
MLQHQSTTRSSQLLRCKSVAQVTLNKFCTELTEFQRLQSLQSAVETFSPGSLWRLTHLRKGFVFRLHNRGFVPNSNFSSLNTLPQRESLSHRGRYILSSRYIATDSQSVRSSWCRARFGADDQILNFFEWQLRPFSSCRAPYLTRGRVCSLQCSYALVRVPQNSWPYFTVSSQTPPTRRARSPYLYPQGIGFTCTFKVNFKSGPLWGPWTDFNFLCLTIICSFM